MFNMQGEYVNIAVKGVINVLQSCKKNPMLKKVVLTSSISTVARPAIFPAGALLDESSWSSAELCENLKVSETRSILVFISFTQNLLYTCIEKNKTLPDVLDSLPQCLICFTI